jgi:hypothetical protein
MGAAGLGAAAIAFLAGCGSSGKYNGPTSFVTVLDPTNFPGITGANEDQVVLNYALTLENLEADLYRQALNLASGRPLSTPLDTTNIPSTPSSSGNYTLSPSFSTGGLSSANAQIGFLYLAQFAFVEAAHRDFLKMVVASQGGTPAAPNPAGYTFPLGNDLKTMLSLIYAVEETGARAYLGAAPFLSVAALQTLTPVAVGIYSTEARHSAALAYVLGLPAGPVYVPSAGVTPGFNVVNGHETSNPQNVFTNPAAAEITFQYYTPPPIVIAAVQPYFNK